MKKSSLLIALGAAVLLTGSTGAHAQIFTSQRDCAVDLKSLCAGVAPGGGRIRACLQSHMSQLSVGCSEILSKVIWAASECRGDIQHFCPDAKYEAIDDCMRPHLGEASDTCRAALAFLASPAGD
jgi:hypothetical protein